LDNRYIICYAYHPAIQWVSVRLSNSAYYSDSVRKTKLYALSKLFKGRVKCF